MIFTKVNLIMILTKVTEIWDLRTEHEMQICLIMILTKAKDIIYHSTGDEERSRESGIFSNERNLQAGAGKIN